MTFALRWPRLAHFLAAAGIAGVALALAVHWHELANGLLGMQVTYDTRPGWLRAAMTVVEWMPALLAAAGCALRARLGPRFRLGSFLLGAVAPLTVALLALFAGPAVEGYLERRPFDAAAWRADAGTNARWPDRLRMVDDLMDRHLRPGLPAAAVEALLGPPDPADRLAGWDAAWRLGLERGLLRLDSEWLAVRYRNGRVSELRVVRH